MGLIVVSNRLPFRIERRGRRIVQTRSTGGLATGLASVLAGRPHVWVGWPGAAGDHAGRAQRALWKDARSVSVHLTNRQVERFYHGFSNRTLWPLLHSYPRATRYDVGEWSGYQEVNRHFCEEVCALARPDDVVWVHDYQLMLLPQLLRTRIPDLTIGYFHHVPFPAADIFKLLPWREEVLHGILGADLIGFHTLDYASNFLASVLGLLGIDHELGRLVVGERIVEVDALPMGIDCARFESASDDPGVQKQLNRFRTRLGPHKIIFSFDRLDYTKGVPERLEAFEKFLQDFPEFHERVVMVQVTSPSRDKIPAYQSLKREIEEIIGRINGAFGSVGWSPIVYLHRHLAESDLLALYVLADVALVTPLRDGMNLIAKEYVAARRGGTGVLVLSEMAGARIELAEAIQVNPNDKEAMVEAIHRALVMKPAEQIQRNQTMLRRLRDHDVVSWADGFLGRLDHGRGDRERFAARVLRTEIRELLLDSWRNGQSRLVLLDYDGTLVPFAEKPEGAAPDADLLRILEQIASVPSTDLVLLTGRDRRTMDDWFGHLPIGLVAEHGVWVRRSAGDPWEIVEPLAVEWKERIRPILQTSARLVPGSMVEEKEYSLAWHYRAATGNVGPAHARELAAILTTISANVEIGVLLGDGVVEVKNVGINKGRCARRWLADGVGQFILAIGDDNTDEALFRVLPAHAFSIRIGLRASFAKYNLLSQSDVRPLLRTLVSTRPAVPVDGGPAS